MAEEDWIETRVKQQGVGGTETGEVRMARQGMCKTMQVEDEDSSSDRGIGYAKKQTGERQIEARKGSKKHKQREREREMGKW